MTDSISLRNRNVPKININSCTDNSSEESFEETTSVLGNSMTTSAAFDRAYALQIIPTLSGKNDIEIFLNQCDSVYEEFGDAGENCLLAIIRSKIPRNVYMSCKDCTTYEEIKKELLKKFGDDTPLSVMMSKLVSLSQTPYEDIKKYSDRAQDTFERLVMLTEGALKKAPKDSGSIKPVEFIYHKILLDYWIKGIKDQNLRQVVMSQNFENFDEACKYAKDVEVVFKCYGAQQVEKQAPLPQNKSQYRSNDTGRNSSFKNDRGRNNFNKTDKDHNKHTGGNNSGAMPKMRCHQCGKTDHFIKDCKDNPHKMSVLNSKNEENPVAIPPDISLTDLMKILSVKQ